jgi:hypothetical protein
MWYDQQFLEQIATLVEICSLHQFEPGDEVVRGYADVGFEEFLVLPGDRLCSKFTGQVTELTSEKREHLFRVPSLEELTDVLCRQGASAISLFCPSGNLWQGTAEVETTNVQIESGLHKTAVEAVVNLITKVSTTSISVNN